MPIFEYEGKKYNVSDEHIDSFVKDFPEATSIMERDGKKFRVKSSDYKSFMSEKPEQDTEQPSTEVELSNVAQEQQEQLTPITEQDKIRMSYDINQMVQRAKKSTEAFSQRMDNMREYAEGFGMGQTVDGKKMYNPETGKIEDTFLTPAGNRYSSKAVADNESFRYRQAADMSVGGQLRRARQKLAELHEKRKQSGMRV